MIKKITIILNEIPPSTNHYKAQRWNGKHIQWYITKKGKEFKEMIKNLDYKWKITTKPIKMNIKLFFPTKRRQDIDNYNKVLLDSLQGIIYEDDNQIVDLRVKKFYEKNKPKTIIRIEELSSQSLPDIANVKKKNGKE